MLHTIFNKNWNNKLLCDCFGTIRVDDTYELHQEREIRYRNDVIGVAKVVALRSFPYSQLTNIVCFVDAGHDLRYMQTVFQKMHGPLDPHRLMRWVMFQWVTPDLNLWSNVYIDAWHKNVEKFATSYRDTPAGCTSIRIRL
jgi:hypothetical protein